jgi:glycosyltransferase involved in cell wall biosynthesis
MDKEVRSDCSHTGPAPGRLLGKLVLLSYYNSYPSARIHHFCTSQWYLLVIEQLQKLGFLDRAEAWFVSDVAMQFVQHGVTVRCFESFDAMAKACEPTDVLWVRGKCKAYVDVLNRMPARLRVYYPASKRFLTSDWNHFDVLLVDDARQVGPVSRLGAAKSVSRVIKTADPAIFRPLDGIEKLYDLCMIGGMQLTRKNHGSLIRALRADPSLTAVVIGKQVPEIADQLRATGASIRFIDFCGREELNRVMNQSRIGFVPSLMDAAPRVILEFMSAGVPVLLNSGILGGRDYVTPETGVLAAEHEFAAVARKIRDGQLKLDARKGFETNFRPEKAAEYLNTVFASALRRSGRTRPEPPPGALRRLIAKPLLLRRQLAQCWKEIEAGTQA